MVKIMWTIGIALWLGCSAAMSIQLGLMGFGFRTHEYWGLLLAYWLGGFGLALTQIDNKDK